MKQFKNKIFSIFRRVLTTDTSKEEVRDTLIALRNRTISDAEWDYFSSVQIADPSLEAIRLRVLELWVHDSIYMLRGSMDPRDLNPKGVAVIDELISKLE